MKRGRWVRLAGVAAGPGVEAAGVGLVEFEAVAGVDAGGGGFAGVEVAAPAHPTSSIATARTSKGGVSVRHVQDTSRRRREAEYGKSPVLARSHDRSNFGNVAP